MDWKLTLSAVMGQAGGTSPSGSPQPANVTSFQRRVFTDVVKLKGLEMGILSAITPLAPNVIARVLRRKRQREISHTHTYARTHAHARRTHGDKREQIDLKTLALDTDGMVPKLRTTGSPTN